MIENELYSKHATKYANLIQNNIYNALYDRPSIEAIIPKQNFDKCLDMGCGPGEYIPILQKFSDCISAFDLSTVFVEDVKKKHPRVNCYKHNLDDPIPEQDENFDLIISPLTLHYVENWDKLFKEIYRICKKGGYFIFSTHHTIIDYSDSPSGDYFKTEYITQEWNLLQTEKTTVSFYRRPLGSIINTALSVGFIIDSFSEGYVSEEIKAINEATYHKLKTKPQFMYFRLKK